MITQGLSEQNFNLKLSSPAIKTYMVRHESNVYLGLCKYTSIKYQAYWLFFIICVPDVLHLSSIQESTIIFSCFQNDSYSNRNL